MQPAVPVGYADRRAVASLNGRDRAEALVLSVLLNLSLFAMLFLLQGEPKLAPEPDRALTVMDIPPPPPEQLPPPPPRQVEAEVAKPARKAAEIPAPPLKIESAAPAAVIPPIILPRPADAAPGEASSGQGATGEGDAGRGAGGGGGTGGAGSGGGSPRAAEPVQTPLRTGQWRQQPSERDFNPPPNMRRGAPRSGWGQIVCVSAPNDRLTDCKTYAEFPAGSGFSEAMRQVAPRFRYMVRDADGNPVIGQRVLVSLNFLEPKRR